MLLGYTLKVLLAYEIPKHGHIEVLFPAIHWNDYSITRIPRKVRQLSMKKGGKLPREGEFLPGMSRLSTRGPTMQRKQLLEVLRGSFDLLLVFVLGFGHYQSNQLQ